MQHPVSMFKQLILKLNETAFVRKAMTEKADLSAFRQPPTPRIIFGVTLIGLSYLIGWPLIGLLGTLAIYFNNPLLVIVGGPIAYGSSHAVFLIGMYLAGAEYTWIFLRWLTRIIMTKLLGAV